MGVDRVDVVCLDAGGVLLFPDWERVSQVLAAHGIVVTAGQLADAEWRARLTFDRPEVAGATDNAGHARSFYEHVMDAAGVRDGEALARALADLRQSHRERNLWEVPSRDAPDALARLRASGRQLVVVSNADGRLRDLLERTRLAPFFDAAIDSHEVGVEKPDPRIFEIALARVNGQGRRAVHVGDIYQVDVIGARAAGLTPILFDPQDLRRAVDCVRVRSLTELADLLEAGGPAASV